MGETNREYVCHPDDKGSINISEEVIAVIAMSSATDTEGVAGLAAGGAGMEMVRGKKNQTRGVKLRIEDEVITVDLWLIVEKGVSVNATAQKVQQAVKSNIESMTGFQVAGVNVHVRGVAVDKSAK